MPGDDNGLDFSSYLASLAHDMKNSLGMLLNTADEILDGCTPETCPSYGLLSRLQYESKRASNNLIQLLTLYKIDKSQLTLNIDYQSVYDFIEETIQYNKPLLDSKGIGIEVNCEQELSWFFDRELISGVINNVLNNTFRYTRDAIRISAGENEGLLFIRIEDNGRGYPEHLTNTMPDAPLKTSFSTGGTGLGLYFGSLVVRMHKNKDREGYILINNNGIDGGGCFTIYLP
jgi:two-component system, OmpR family, sensor histidine kinase SenX3